MRKEKRMNVLGVGACVSVFYMFAIAMFDLELGTIVATLQLGLSLLLGKALGL